MNPWVAAGATAALMSERGRSLLRRGLVYAVAGAMNAGAALASGATEVAHGAERVASSAGDLAGGLVGEAQKTRQSSDNKSSTAKGSIAQRRARRSRATKPKTAGASE
jgi:hypothetical protein